MSDEQFNMQPVSSSNISAIGYDESTETMRVQFHKSGTYDLAAVPKAEYEMLMKSQSIGSTYAQFFRGQYDTSKL